MTNPIHFLRATVLTIDAITCLGMGALLSAAAAGPLAGLFDLPAVLLFEAEAAALPLAKARLHAADRAGRAAHGADAAKKRLQAGGRFIALLNLGLDRGQLHAVIALLAPNPLGAAFIVLQALAVAGGAMLFRSNSAACRCSRRAFT